MLSCLSCVIMNKLCCLNWLACLKNINIYIKLSPNQLLNKDPATVKYIFLRGLLPAGCNVEECLSVGHTTALQIVAYWER